MTDEFIITSVKIKQSRSCIMYVSLCDIISDQAGACPGGGGLRRLQPPPKQSIAGKDLTISEYVLKYEYVLK